MINMKKLLHKIITLVIIYYILPKIKKIFRQLLSIFLRTKTIQKNLDGHTQLKEKLQPIEAVLSKECSEQLNSPALSTLTYPLELSASSIPFFLSAKSRISRGRAQPISPHFFDDTPLYPERLTHPKRQNKSLH